MMNMFQDFNIIDYGFDLNYYHSKYKEKLFDDILWKNIQ
jgi:hypothetical protein